jgi:hypothetical protein
MCISFPRGGAPDNREDLLTDWTVANPPFLQKDGDKQNGQ